MPSRILIIDDDRALLKLMSDALARAGFTTFTAKDGGEGARVFRNQDMDLVITDILMPNTEGIETIMTLKRKLRPPRIIAISGGGRAPAAQLLEWARMLGADDVLIKPFMLSALVAMARSMLGKIAPPIRSGWPVGTPFSANRAPQSAKKTPCAS